MNRHDTSPASLAELSSDALLTGLHGTRDDERNCIVQFLYHLAEVDRRELHLALGYSSLFAYLNQGLRFPNACAFRRMTSAHLITTYPVVADYLRDGRLCLTTLTELNKVITPENHQSILDAAAGQTEEEVKLLVASLRPRPETRDTIRLLSSPAPAAAPATPPNAAGSPRPADPPESTSGAPAAFDLASVAPPPSEPRRPRIEPINAERYSITMHVGREFMDELKQVKSALSHIIPDGNLEAVLRTCIQTTLDVRSRRKHAARSKPARARTARTSGPEVAAPLAADLPRTSGPEVAAPPGADLPRASGPEVAAPPGSGLPRTSGPEVASPLPADLPRTSGPEVDEPPGTGLPRTSGPEVAAPPGSGLPRTSGPEVARPLPADLPRTSGPEVRGGNSRYAAAEERRAVWARDEGMCVWVGLDGKRCCSTHQLEFAHVISVAKGGEPTRRNLRLLCSRHNAYEARLEFGAEFMSRFARGRGDPKRRI